MDVQREIVLLGKLFSALECCGISSFSEDLVYAIGRETEIITLREVRLEVVEDEYEPVIVSWGAVENPQQLMSEKIFGPKKDFRCECGRYSKKKFQGVICDKCGVEVTRSLVRYLRLGHINLQSPVIHPVTGITIKKLPVIPAGLRELENNWKKLTILYERILESNNPQKSRNLQSAVNALYYPSLINCFDEAVLEAAEDKIFPLLSLNDIVELARKKEVIPVNFNITITD